MGKSTLGNGLVMLIQALLGRSVVVGRDGQRCVGAERFCLPRKVNGFGGGIRPSASNHRYSTSDDLNGAANHLQMFVDV